MKEEPTADGLPFRYFDIEKDDVIHRWRFASDARGEYWDEDEWVRSSLSMGDVMSDYRVIETDEHGTPLPAEAGMPLHPPVRPHDWPEDASHENGGYECQCVYCNSLFYGHKRRVICKVCATLVDMPPPSDPQPPREWWILGGALFDRYPNDPAAIRVREVPSIPASNKSHP